MSKGQKTVCLSRAFVTSPRREVVISVARDISEIICHACAEQSMKERKPYVGVYSDLSVVSQLGQFVYYVISRAYFRQTSVDRVHPVLGPRFRLFVKNFYMKLKCDFKTFLLKKLMECRVTAVIESRIKSTRRFSQRACR